MSVNGGGGGSEMATESEVINRYRVLQNEVQMLSSKSTELDQDRQEHELVLEALNGAEDGRKCFRFMGGVLVERTVGEVRPAVTRYVFFRPPVRGVRSRSRRAGWPGRAPAAEAPPGRIGGSTRRGARFSPRRSPHRARARPLGRRHAGTGTTSCRRCRSSTRTWRRARRTSRRCRRSTRSGRPSAARAINRSRRRTERQQPRAGAVASLFEQLIEASWRSSGRRSPFRRFFLRAANPSAEEGPPCRGHGCVNWSATKASRIASQRARSPHCGLSAH